MRNYDASIDAAQHRQSHLHMKKIAEDVDRYQLLVDLVRPTVIIETGTWTGRSALWFAQRSDAFVYTVDSDGTDRVNPIVQRVAEARGVCFVRGDSVWMAPTVLEEAAVVSNEFEDRVLISLDSDHHAEHVYAEMHAYADTVTVGSYLVVEDTILRYLTGPIVPADCEGTSPMDAVERFLLDRNDFVRDFDIEDLHDVTCHPGGWLKKVR